MSKGCSLALLGSALLSAEGSSGGSVEDKRLSGAGRMSFMLFFNV